MAASEPSTPSRPPAKTTWYYGWVIVGLCTAIVFVVTGTKGSFGALFKDMQKDLGWDRGTTAGASAISTLAWGLTLPLVGTLVDRYGPKRVMVASIFLMIVAVVPISPWVGRSLHPSQPSSFPTWAGEYHTSFSAPVFS